MCVLSANVYFFRINDDTIFFTSHWMDRFLNVLHSYNPSNLGVVGPNHMGGNIKILTYDFVHRTHCDIFGYYYPRMFKDWYADDWITLIYKGINRMKKITDVRIKHTMKLGSRYKQRMLKIEKRNALLKETIAIANQWVSFQTLSKDRTSVAGKSLISVCLSKNNINHTMGALRNVVLAKKLMPNWDVRIYVNDKITHNILQSLHTFGAEIVLINEEEMAIPSDYWAYLVADDPNVHRFIVRNVTHRLSPRQAGLINDWQLSDHAYHTIRDRPWHSDMALVPDLFGAVREHLYHKLNTRMFDIILDATQKGRIDDVRGLLNDVIWPAIKEDVLSHDSVAADKWTGSVPFNKTLFDAMKIGQPTSQHEQEFDGDITEFKDKVTYNAPKRGNRTKLHDDKFHK